MRRAYFPGRPLDCPGRPRRQLRRLSGHREVNYAKVGEKMLADLQAAYVQHVAEDGVR
jgi:hypothetical protein